LQRVLFSYAALPYQKKFNAFNILIYRRAGRPKVNNGANEILTARQTALRTLNDNDNDTVLKHKAT
jgi:hypothetical protein